MIQSQCLNLVWIQFSFSKTVFFTMTKELSLPYWRIMDRFLPFPKALVRSETQTTSSRIWTQISDSISYNCVRCLLYSAALKEWNLSFISPSLSLVWVGNISSFFHYVTLESFLKTLWNCHYTIYNALLLSSHSQCTSGFID